MLKPIVATKTLAAIESSMMADQGASFRQLLEPILPKMDDAYRGESSPFRSHLGVSLIGRECARDLWYGFRWAKQPKFEARVLRLFNRGHLEEARFIALLQMIGVEVWYETDTGGQFRVSHFNGHMGSALDGVGKGIPDIPALACAYTEFKTSAAKGFKKVKKEGILIAKPEHYTQMQVCMHKYDLPYGLYMMVNKDDDDIYAEIITLDRQYANAFLDRGGSIIFTDKPPMRIGSTPAWYKCKFCDKKEVCHGTELPEKNCRTCCHSTPEQDGAWSCAKGNILIQSNDKYVGCDQHVYNPYMLNKVEHIGGDFSANYVDLRFHDGKEVRHGPNFITSDLLCLDQNEL